MHVRYLYGKQKDGGERSVWTVFSPKRTTLFNDTMLANQVLALQLANVA